jgi:DNA topoisomerase-2
MALSHFHFFPLQLPNYKNFKGTIQELGQNQYAVSGEIFVVDRNTVEITELPVRTWTQVSFIM